MSFSSKVHPDTVARLQMLLGKRDKNGVPPVKQPLPGLAAQETESARAVAHPPAHVDAPQPTPLVTPK